MDPEAQDLVREVYGAPLFSRYGLMEVGAVVAQSCQDHVRAGGYAHERMHVNAYGYLVEVVDDEGRPGNLGRRALRLRPRATRLRPWPPWSGATARRWGSLLPLEVKLVDSLPLQPSSKRPLLKTLEAYRREGRR